MMKNSKKFRLIVIILAIIGLPVVAYYIKSDVLRINLIDNRHLLFFKKPFETFQERAERLQLFQDLLRRSMAGEQIGWEGKSRVDGHIYQYGNMYWSGSVYTVVILPEGEAVIGLKARGTPAKAHYPYMVVELDGREIDSLYLDSPQWKEYAFKVNTRGGRKILSVTFTNDAENSKTREDRNLYVGEVRVLSP